MMLAVIPKGALGSHEGVKQKPWVWSQGSMKASTGGLGSGLSLFVPEEELDLRLIRTKGGVDAALEYAKAWSRYAKELLAWTDKRANYGEASFRPTSDGRQDPSPSCL